MGWFSKKSASTLQQEVAAITRIMAKEPHGADAPTVRAKMSQRRATHSERCLLIPTANPTGRHTWRH